MVGFERYQHLGNGFGALDGETAASLRASVLFFLANSHTSAIPSNMMSFLNDGTDTSSDVHAFIDTGSASRWRFWEGSFYDDDNKQNGFLESLSERLIEYIKELAILVKLDEFAVSAAQFVVQGIPELLLKVFAGLLAKLTAVLDIGRGLRDAAKAGVAIWKTRLCEDGVLSGHPRIVIHSVREQIKNSGYDGLKGAIKAGALAGLTAIPGVGTVAGAIATP